MKKSRSESIALIRNEWVRLLEQMARPVLEAGARDELKSTMRIEQLPGMDRERCSSLEAAGRLICGISPWLVIDTGEQAEQVLRQELRRLAVSMVKNQLDPNSSDYCRIEEKPYCRQLLVDLALLSLDFLRAPDLFADLQSQLKRALLCARKYQPSYNNWLLFSLIIEVALESLGEEPDLMRLDYIFSQFERWYIGDGIYADGPRYHADYYNSFVIHPILLAATKQYKLGFEKYLVRAQRYAQILERHIAPDGSYIILGRSAAYRCGAFHLLADLSLRQNLPDELPPAQIRTGLSAVLRKTLLPDSYRNDGFLRIGVCGKQPAIGEPYISTGSLYLAATIFLPLGLTMDTHFWTEDDEPWTQKKIWYGVDVTPDHAIE